ncbi:hypothetical protein ACQCRI_13440 [Ralstonia pseudosolanacearum]|uniref:hypothetical protein n=2 Tax=Ralstonia pseudosolanacearum TaxID=1310165 RepID=UPI0005C70F24|nr:hypothetical protein [Ralstonia pseudosolanacearum]
MMRPQPNRFDTQKSEHVVLPLQRYISLPELIEWIGTFDVEIPNDVEQTISAFGLKWDASLAPQEQARAMLFPPEPKLANLFRRGMAAALLFRELSERESEAPVWHNWLITGSAVRLRAEERGRAWSMLERIALEAEQTFSSILALGARWRPLKELSSAFAPSDRQWLDALGFEKKEIFAFLYPDLIVADSMSASVDALDVIPTGVTLAPQGRVVRFGGERRNALTGLIEAAIKKAGGSHSASEVWPHLKELALRETPPFNGALGDDGALLYTRESAGKQSPSAVPFSFDALASRLQRMKKKPKVQEAEEVGGGQE